MKNREIVDMTQDPEMSDDIYQKQNGVFENGK